MCILLLDFSLFSELEFYHSFLNIPLVQITTYSKKKKKDSFVKL